MAKVLGYARVSTGDGQDASSQKSALEALGAVVVFADIGNGSSLAGRDQLEAALRLLEPGDELLALHPDRLARDTGDLLTIGKRVVGKGAVLRIHDPKIVFDGTAMMAASISPRSAHAFRRPSRSGSVSGASLELTSQTYNTFEYILVANR